MARKPVSGFAEAGAAMAQQLDDNDLLNLFSAVGRVVSKRFLMKRPSLTPTICWAMRDVPQKSIPWWANALDLHQEAHDPPA